MSDLPIKNKAPTEHTVEPRDWFDYSCLDCRNHNNNHCTVDWVSCLKDDNPFNLYEPSKASRRKDGMDKRI